VKFPITLTLLSSRESAKTRVPIPRQTKMIERVKGGSLCWTGQPDQGKSYFAVGIFCTSGINLWISGNSREIRENGPSCAQAAREPKSRSQECPRARTRFVTHSTHTL